MFSWRYECDFAILLHEFLSGYCCFAHFLYFYVFVFCYKRYMRYLFLKWVVRNPISQYFGERAKFNYILSIIYRAMCVKRNTVFSQTYLI